jgi:hypothetical protein
LGETLRAIDFFEQCLVIARETGDRSDEAAALWSKALVLDQLENRAEAMVHAEAALCIYEQIKSPHAEIVRNSFAEWKAGDGEDQRLR